LLVRLSKDRRGRLLEDFKSSDGIDVRIHPQTGSPSIDDRFSLLLPYGQAIPADLAAIVDAWPKLPAAIRAGILAMARAASAT
jgi:hypothetical protein